MKIARKIVDSLLGADSDIEDVLFSQVDLWAKPLGPPTGMKCQCTSYTWTGFPNGWPETDYVNVNFTVTNTLVPHFLSSVDPVAGAVIRNNTVDASTHWYAFVANTHGTEDTSHIRAIYDAVKQINESIKLPNLRPGEVITIMNRIFESIESRSKNKRI